MKSLSVQRAPIVGAGSSPSSAEYNKQAEAFNDRLDIGFADGVYRIFYDTLAFIRNTKTNEHHLELLKTSSLWGSGYELDTLSANNPLVQWAKGYGSNAITARELVRLTNYTSSYITSSAFKVAYGGTDEDIFHQITQSQGCYISESKLIESATVSLPLRYNSFYTLNQSGQYSVYNHCGGYVQDRSGEVIGTCYDVQDPLSLEIVPYNNCRIILRNIYTNATESFSPTCIATTGSYSLSSTTDTYKISQLVDKGSYNEWEVTRSFNRSEWTIGPYDNNGGVLGHIGIYPDLESNTNNYIKDFRGKYSDWVTQSYSLGNAFDFQYFFTRPYVLAPHWGTMVGDKPTRQDVIGYLSGSYQSGSTIPINSGSSYSVHPNFVIGQYFVDTKNLLSTCSFNLHLSNSIVYTSPELSASNGYLYTFDYPITGSSTGSFDISLTLNNNISSSFKIYLQETRNTLPTNLDAYWFLRLSDYNYDTDEEVAAETFPSQSNNGPTILTNYKKYGCPVNLTATSYDTNQEYLGSNAMANSFVKNIMPYVSYIPSMDYTAETPIIVGYGVADDKSYIYVKPETYMYNIINPFDYNITNKIKSDCIYEVTGSGGNSGSIEYSGSLYAVNERFTGSFDSPNITSITGSPTIMLINDIFDYAPTQSYSKTWYALPQIFPWGRSITEENQYSKYYELPLFNRALFGTPYNKKRVIESFGSVDRYFDSNNDVYGNLSGLMDMITWPEYPSNYSYWLTLDNSSAVNGDISIFNLGAYLSDIISNYDGTPYIQTSDKDKALSLYCKSNQIHKPPYKVESVDTNADYSGSKYWKITFTERFQTHPSASVSVDENDTANWDCSSQNYRTDENALMDWLLIQKYGEDTVCDGYGVTGKVRPKIGEFNGLSYFGSPDYLDSFVPYACLPMSLLMVRGIPLTYEDNNIEYNETDTRMETLPYHQMEYYLKCMCPGYVGTHVNPTVIKEAIETGEISRFGVFSTITDFDYETLCFKATGKTKLKITVDESDYSKTAYGITQLPNTVLWSEQFNLISRCINSLVESRLMLPIRAYSSYTYGNIRVGGPDNTLGGNPDRWAGGGAVMITSSFEYSTVHAPIVEDNYFISDNTWNQFQTLGNIGTLSSYVSTMGLGEYTDAYGNATFANLGEAKYWGYNYAASSYKFSPNQVYLNSLPYDTTVNTNYNVWVLENRYDVYYTIDWTTSSLACDTPFRFSYNPAVACGIIYPGTGGEGQPPPLYAHGIPHVSTASLFYSAPLELDVMVSGSTEGTLTAAGVYGELGDVAINSAGDLHIRELNFIKDAWTINLSLHN